MPDEDKQPEEKAAEEQEGQEGHACPICQRDLAPGCATVQMVRVGRSCIVTLILDDRCFHSNPPLAQYLVAEALKAADARIREEIAKVAPGLEVA